MKTVEITTVILTSTAEWIALLAERAEAEIEFRPYIRDEPMPGLTLIRCQPLLGSSPAPIGLSALLHVAAASRRSASSALKPP